MKARFHSKVSENKVGPPSPQSKFMDPLKSTDKLGVHGFQVKKGCSNITLLPGYLLGNWDKNLISKVN
jgi:hypothetical protein